MSGREMLRRATRRHRTFAVGAALLGAYVLAAVVTMRIGPLQVRPLYDIGATPPAYQWVNPPTALAKGNIHPKPGTSPVAWTPNGNEADSPSAPDGQAIVSIPSKAIATRSGDEGVDAHFTPLDPVKSPLPAQLPPGLRPDGNAYRITLEYTPSRAPVTSFAKPPLVLLRWATNGTALLYSPDGKQWQRVTKNVQIAQAPDALISADFPGNGYYLAASNGSLLPTKAKGGFPIVTLVVGAFIVIPLAVIVWFVFPRRQTPPAKGSKGSTSRR